MHCSVSSSFLYPEEQVWHLAACSQASQLATQGLHSLAEVSLYCLASQEVLHVLSVFLKKPEAQVVHSEAEEQLLQFEGQSLAWKLQAWMFSSWPPDTKMELSMASKAET